MADTEDQVEVTVSVPDSPDSGEDANDNGVPDVVETGVALERATQASDVAEDAAAVADAAAANAAIAGDVAFSADERTEQNSAAIAAVTEQVGRLTAITAQLVEAMNTQAGVILSENAKPEPLPNEKDDPPESRHWLNRPLWGRK